MQFRCLEILAWTRIKQPGKGSRAGQQPSESKIPARKLLCSEIRPDKLAEVGPDGSRLVSPYEVAAVETAATGLADFPSNRGLPQ